MIKIIYRNFNPDTFVQDNDIPSIFNTRINYGMKKRLRPFVSNRVNTSLKVIPGKPSYPIKFTKSRGTYSKQQAAFFASGGFGGGIPYSRSGRKARGWHVRGSYPKEGIGFIEIYNEDPDAWFVYGDADGKHQQAFHATTGWPHARTELNRIEEETSIEFDKMLDDIIKDYNENG